MDLLFQRSHRFQRQPPGGFQHDHQGLLSPPGDPIGSRHWQAHRLRHRHAHLAGNDALVPHSSHYMGALSPHPRPINDAHRRRYGYVAHRSGRPIPGRQLCHELFRPTAYVRRSRRLPGQQGAGLLPPAIRP